MKKHIFLFTIFIVLACLTSQANYFELNNDSVLKNTIGLNFSLINTPQISYYLSSPISKRSQNTISPKMDLSYNRFLRKKFYVGISLSFTDLTFKGNDYHPIDSSYALISKLNYKIILGYISLNKEFNITENFIISPSIETGIGTNISGFLHENIVKNNDIAVSNTSVLNQKYLIVSTILQTNFVYKIKTHNKIYIGIGASDFDVNYYDYLPIKNIYNLNVGYKYAF